MKRVRHILGGVLLTVLLLGVLLAGGVQTTVGKKWLAAGLSKVLSGDGYGVQLSEISGLIPVNVSVGRIEVADPGGVWLTLENVHCRWVAKALRGDELRVNALSAQRVVLNRFPERASNAEKSEKSAWSVPVLPMELVLNQFVVGEWVLGEAIAGEVLNYEVAGGDLHWSRSGRVVGKMLVRGDAVGVVEFEGRLPDEESSGHASLRVELECLDRPSMGLDELSGFLKATISEAGVEGEVVIAFRKQDYSGTMAGGAQYHEGKVALNDFHFETAGWRVEGDAQCSVLTNDYVVALNADAMDVSSNRYSLGGQARVTRDGTRWTVAFEPLEVRCFDALRCTLTGGMSEAGMALQGLIDPVDLGAFALAKASGLRGKVAGGIRISGPLAEPVVEVALEMKGFSSGRDVLDEVPELDFHIDGGIAQGRLFATTQVTNAIYGEAKAALEMPCSFSVKPLTVELKPKEMVATMSADMDLRMFNSFPMFNAQRVAGVVEADFRYEKGLSGGVRLQDGFYEHYDHGVVVRDVAMELEASESGLTVKSASATDGRSGRATLTGSVGIWEEPIPLDLQVDVDAAEMIKRDDVGATLSGQLAIGGVLRHPEIRGHIAVERADILLDNMAAAAPPLLENFDLTQTNERTSAVSTEARRSRVGLDLTVDLQDQVFLNASVIDSVWGGRLHIQDQPEGISVSGSVSPRRGYFSFVGKKFRLLEEGRIELDGVIPLQPMLNLRAEYQRSDIVAQLSLTGRMNNPSYSLESLPALPEDEVLSQVLFNRDTTTISPYQAYQIAAAAEQLSGGLRGAGWMYKTRQALSMDTLEWREPDAAGESSSLAAGKYLTPELYVEVNSSLDSEGGRGLSAEYEVTRNLTIETSTGAQMRPGIGVNWKKDY